MNKMTSSCQLNDLRSYSRHWLGEFIDQYQNAECLWQPKHPDYSNHTARNRAYDRLVEKLKEVEPNPDRAMVVRKINSLRSAFRREYRKTTSKSNYETRLWYYDRLLFIAGQNPKRVSSDSVTSVKLPAKRSLPLTFDDDDSLEYEDEQHLEHQTSGSEQNIRAEHQPEPIGTLTMTSTGDCVTLVKNEDHHQQHHLQQQQQQQQQQQHMQHPSPGQAPTQHTAVKVLEITSLDSNSQREIQQAVNSLEQQHMQQLQHQQNGQTTTAQLTQVPTIQIAREHLQPLFGNPTYSTAVQSTHRQEDEYDAIGINVASKLRCMNPTQRIIAEKLISDVLFNAQLDNLSVHSAVAHQ